MAGSSGGSGAVEGRWVRTIGRIAYRREGGDGSAQRGRSVIYTIALLYEIAL